MSSSVKSSPRFFRIHLYINTTFIIKLYYTAAQTALGHSILALKAFAACLEDRPDSPCLTYMDRYAKGYWQDTEIAVNSKGLNLNVTKLIGKRVVDFLLVLKIVFFSLLLRR